MPDSEFGGDERTGVVRNRRAFPRTPFSGPVLVDTLKEWHKVEAVDVSAGGIRLKSDFPLPLGSEVELYFELSHVSVETKATVVRRQGEEVALVFERDGTGQHRPKIASWRPRAA